MFRYDIDSLDNRDPAAIDRLVRIVEATLVHYHRAEVRGVARIPAGRALYVGNHNSYTYTPDSWLFGAAVYRQLGLDAVPYGLGHEIALEFLPINRFVCPLGAVRASHENGERLLWADKKVLVYPGGDFDALRPYRHRDRVVFGGRCGFVRLALRTGAPIVPVVAAGAHSTFIVIDDLRWLARAIRSDKWMRSKVWPLTFSVPWGFTLGLPPPWFPFPSKILIEVLEPIVFEGTGPADADDPAVYTACAEQVQSTMQAALTRLEAERRGR